MKYIGYSVRFVLVFRVSYLSNQTIDVNVTTTNYVIVNVTSSEALHEIRVTAWTGAGQGPPATFTLLTPKLSKKKYLILGLRNYRVQHYGEVRERSREAVS